MKITNFSPSLITPNAEEFISIFEELGFERQHTKEDIDSGKVTSVTMKDENGNYFTVSGAPVPRDMLAVRMNVDNFEEAYEFLKSKGFVNTRGDERETTGNSISAYMLSPTGFAIVLTEHIK